MLQFLNKCVIGLSWVCFVLSAALLMIASFIYLIRSAHAEDQILPGAPHLMDVERFPMTDSPNNLQKFTIHNVSDHDIVITNIKVNDGNHLCHLISVEEVANQGKTQTVPHPLDAGDSYDMLKFGPACKEPLYNAEITATESVTSTFEFDK